MYEPESLFDRFTISRHIGKFVGDQRVMFGMIVAAIALAGYTWLAESPQHNPFSPLDVRDPPGLTTKMKMMEVIENRNACRMALARSGVEFRSLTPIGEAPCALKDRTQVTAAQFSPGRPVATCPVAAGLQIWLNNGLQEAAQTHMGSKVVRIDHLGTSNCRRVNNGRSGPWSEHATGNAIDISAFVLADGRRITVSGNWDRGDRGAFLKDARGSACESFKTVLSPDYNAEHAGHFHLDQGTRWATACR